MTRFLRIAGFLLGISRCPDCGRYIGEDGPA
jgi:hypothetical protein